MTLRILLLRFTAIILLLTGLSCAVDAQATVSGIESRLKDRTLFLRGLWAEDDLRFDADGKPVAHYNQRPFTESAFDLHSARFDGGTLILEGQRTALVFDKNEKTSFVAIHGKIRHDKYDGRVRIEVRGKLGQDFGPALDAIFTTEIADLAPLLPPIWQFWVREHYPGAALPAIPEAEKLEKAVANFRRSGKPSGNDTSHESTTAPKLIHSQNPEYSETAKMRRLSGTTLIYCWVDEHGNPSHVYVAKAAGAGLDEEAVRAVRQYVFAPATKDGKPVKVDLYIAVNFRIW